jgi:hypothetical protein
MVYRVGSAEGFYGDNVLSALPMILGGHVDAICFEALAELTLAILQKDKLKDPNRGYTFDLQIIAARVLPDAFRRRIPLISNGGGLNPVAAAHMVAETARKAGLQGVKIAAITGDDVFSRLEELHQAGERFEHLETSQPLDPGEYQLTNANVYMGARPIVEALKAGADFVITGRVADPCLYLAPLVAHYGWAWDDWDRLGAGIVAGHLLECTGQVVGGNSLALIDTIDPHELPRLGYPIAHVHADGTFVLTNTPGQGGIVNTSTVKEQLLYEVHDPARYVTPDVVADFTTLTLADIGANQVRVSGVTGRPAPEKLKLNFGRLEGFMREIIYTLGYPYAWKKYDQLKILIRETLKPLAIDRIAFHLLGVNSLFGSASPLPEDPMELVVRVMFTAKDEATLKNAVRLLMNNGLSGPAGVSVSGTTVGGEPRAIIGLFPTLIERTHIQHQIHYVEV